MRTDQYHYLLFDFGNVLFDIDIPLAYDRIRALMKKDADPSIFKAAAMKYETGKITTDFFINAVLSQCGPRVQALDVIEAWNSMLIGMPEHRLSMLELLRPHYRLYLLSNTNELHIQWVSRYLKQQYGMHDFEERYWDGVYYSHKVHDRKPNLSIFQRIMTDTGMAPTQTLFMDDVQENIDAAIQLGFETHLVQPPDDIAVFLKGEGFY
jgi:FMN phosphatase YigB (HAD superfamily)